MYGRQILVFVNGMVSLNTLDLEQSGVVNNFNQFPLSLFGVRWGGQVAPNSFQCSFTSFGLRCGCHCLSLDSTLRQIGHCVWDSGWTLALRTTHLCLIAPDPFEIQGYRGTFLKTRSTTLSSIVTEQSRVCGLEQVYASVFVDKAWKLNPLNTSQALSILLRLDSPRMGNFKREVTFGGRWRKPLRFSPRLGRP